jgi:cytochrome d ubiquinol oxidase subunit I
VSTALVLTSLIAFTLTYGALAVADGYLLVKYAKGDPVFGHESESEATASLVELY